MDKLQIPALQRVEISFQDIHIRSVDNSVPKSNTPISMADCGNIQNQPPRINSWRLDILRQNLRDTETRLQQRQRKYHTYFTADNVPATLTTLLENLKSDRILSESSSSRKSYAKKLNKEAADMDMESKRLLRTKAYRKINRRGLCSLQHVLGLLDSCSDVCPHSRVMAPEIQTALEGADSKPESMESEAGLYTLTANSSDPSYLESLVLKSPPLNTSLHSGSQEFLNAPIFIAIDFEFNPSDKETQTPARVRELGIANFDTRDLYTQRYMQTCDLISSQHYRIKSKSKETPFCKTIDITEDELIPILRRLFYLEKEPETESRKIILVSQGLEVEDLQILNHLGLYLHQIPSIVEVLDTAYLSLEVFQKMYPLFRLAEKTKIPISHKFFHQAAADANFTMRVMLVLACSDDGDSKTWKVDPQIRRLRKEILMEIAYDTTAEYEWLSTRVEEWNMAKLVKWNMTRNADTDENDSFYPMNFESIIQ